MGNQDRIMPGNQAGTDETTNNDHAYDTTNNHNNFYSKHSHADVYQETGNNNANAYVGSNKGNWAGSSTHQNGAHFHQDGTDNTDPYDQTHKNAALYSGN